MILAFICNVNETVDKDDKDAGRAKSAIPYFTSGHFHLRGSSVSNRKAQAVCIFEYIDDLFMC